jgi:carbonic anhydrase
MKNLLIVAIVLVVSSAAYVGQGTPWGYEASNGSLSVGKLNRDWVLCAEGNQQSPVDLTGAKQEKFDEMNLEFPTANLTIIH